MRDVVMKGLLLPLYSHPPFSCCLEQDQMWKHFVLTEAIPVPKCLWRFLQVLTLHCLREYENVRCLQTRVEQTSEIPLYQKKLLSLVPEIRNKTDAASQETQGTAEVLFPPFQCKDLLLKQLFGSAADWRLFTKPMVFRSWTAWQVSIIDISEEYCHHLLNTTLTYSRGFFPPTERDLKAVCRKYSSPLVKGHSKKES